LYRVPGTGNHTRSPHHLILSSASQPQTADTAHALELLYIAYSNRFSSLPKFQHDHPKLKVKLFRDRAEFRRSTRGWVAEAYYREPYCLAYFSVGEINPCHWMLHESVHQLNREVARLELAKWLEEGWQSTFQPAALSQMGSRWTN